MTMEVAFKAAKLGSWTGWGNWVGPAAGFSVGHERVAISVGRTYCPSLRLAPVACSDSPQSPAPARRKKKIEVSLDVPKKTELKLLIDLQEFIGSCDLPPNEVPTTAELARHGRQDLANRVRRKGYKQVAQLLKQVRIRGSVENFRSEGATIPQNGPVVHDDGIVLSSAKTDDSVSIDLEEPSAVGSSTDGLPLSACSSINHANVNGHTSFGGELVRAALADGGVHVPEVGRDLGVLGESSLQGQLVEDSNQDTSGVGLSVDVTTEDGGGGSIEEVCETDDKNDGGGGDDGGDDDFYHENDEDSRQISGRSHSKSKSPDIVYQKAALLKAKLLRYFDSRSEDFKEANSLPSANRMKQNAATQQEWAPEDLDQSRVIQKMETPKELNQLKSLLHSRELELAEVSKQLEESRAMLSLARAKATAELVHVKQLTAEQDTRLQAAEQALSQMKQVNLEWWGEACRVELAGSFNGWQHYILLEPDFSSEICKPDGARGPMMWGTHLCLYPGMYEIKFIVDGNWQVDHRREVVTRHSYQNNILRVE